MTGLVFKPLNALKEYDDYLNLKESREEIMKDILLEKSKLKANLPTEKGELSPYIEILQGNDIDLKLSVIDKLSLDTDPKRVAMLKTALNDSNSEVKFTAAAGLRKLEDRFNIRIAELKKECRYMVTNDHSYAELGTTYDNYSYCGILDSETSRYYKELAIESFTRAISINPFAEDYYKNLGRLLLRTDNIEKAIDVLENGLKINHDSLKIKTWLIEYYYKQENFEKLVTLSREIKLEELPSQQLKDVVTWWINA
ncbi:MAG: hypothetical protein ACE5GM_04695 [bacterium]